MNVSLTNDLHDFVRQKVESGEFPSEEAVLQEAVRRRENRTRRLRPRTLSITSSSPIALVRRTTP